MKFCNINLNDEKFYKINPQKYAEKLKEEFSQNKSLWYNAIFPQAKAEELYIETNGDYSKIWHVHCESCWQKIDRQTQTDCFATKDKLVWLCNDCYQNIIKF